ncbi:MAG: hypothetical protein ABEK02_06250 [Haloquadratum sp.]
MADTDGTDGADDRLGVEQFRPDREPIEPGDPDVENAVFVILGALGTIVLLVSVLAPGLV